MNFFKSLCSHVVVAISALLPWQAHAEWTPNKPIKMILGYPPGGAADAMARDVTSVMEKVLGQPFVIEYRSGAAGAIGAEAVATAAPDGYTIGIIDGGPLTIAPHSRKMPYNPGSSFSYIGVVGMSPLVILVNPQVPAKTLPELIELARKRPGALTYASSGQGSPQHMAAELFKSITGTYMVHVPYRGAAPALTDLMGGQVQLSFASIAPAVGMIKTGKVTALAVTSHREVPSLPGIKPASTLGLTGYDAQGWFVMAAPKGVPDAVLTRLNSALNDALLNPTVSEKMTRLGIMSPTTSPREAEDLVKRDAIKWQKLIREQNLKFD